MVSAELIELFRPEELELMVCGSKSLNFEDLKEACHYVDGYTEESQISIWLWEIIMNDMNDFNRK